MVWSCAACGVVMVGSFFHIQFICVTEYVLRAFSARTWLLAKPCSEDNSPPPPVATALRSPRRQRRRASLGVLVALLIRLQVSPRPVLLTLCRVGWFGVQAWPHLLAPVARTRCHGSCCMQQHFCLRGGSPVPTVLCVLCIRAVRSASGSHKPQPAWSRPEQPEAVDGAEPAAMDNTVPITLKVLASHVAVGSVIGKSGKPQVVRQLVSADSAKSS